jgi:hypothetical protein
VGALVGGRVLIYEMLVGVPPFYDETATDDETFNRILKDRPRFHSFVGARASRRLLLLLLLLLLSLVSLVLSLLLLLF